MALDKQRILNELGNVVNQLKSADCGCLGNVFSGQNAGGQMMGGSPLPTCGGCRRGCCQGHGGCGAASAGDSMNVNRSCMGRCNAPQLFTETYGYLNQNLVQPTMKEVMEDMRSLTPTNTIANSPLANQMGLSTGNVANPMMGQSQPPMGMQGMNGMIGSPGMNFPNNQMSSMGKMGEQIMKMMMSSNKSKGMPPQGQMIGSNPMNTNSHVQGGMAPMISNNPGEPNNLAMSMAQGDPTANQTQYQDAGNMNTQNMMNPQTQYVTKDNNYTVGQAQMNPTCAARHLPQMMNPTQGSRSPNFVGGNLAQGLVPGGPQSMSASPYGQHTAGVNKFNEMFPGLSQHGELGFDPMAIALQMNPANQKKAAMQTMQKIMNGNVGAGISNFMGAQSNLPQNQAQLQQIPQQHIVGQANQLVSGQQQFVPGQEQLIQETQAIPVQQQLSQGQQQSINPYSGTGQLNQQQAYTAVTGGQKFEGQQQIIDANSANMVETPATYELSGDDPTAPNAQMEMNKEPIFPAETLKNNPLQYQPHKLFKNNTEYNTLGQPVERVPGHIYNVPIPNLPQTLSPRVPSRTKINNLNLGLKSTVSKTSLAGLKPIGRVPSRSQLQKIYHQFKVPQSQSYTHHSIREPVQRGTASDGKLNATPVDNTAYQQIPIEKVGGDTIANNQIEKAKEHIGDAPESQKPIVGGDIDKPRPMKPARNGLQDMVYSSYPSNAAWSFHGDYSPPMPSLYYRSKVNTVSRKMR